LPSLRDALYGNPWLVNQMSASQPLDFLRLWYNGKTVYFVSLNEAAAKE
jgi:hypothetical protein